MNEPRYQFWRPIQPVEGQPIPDGAEYKLVVGSLSAWTRSMTGGVFLGVDTHLEWRVPAEVVPIDLMADFIVENRTVDHYKRLWALNICAKTPEQLRELVIARLRELSQEAS